MIRRDGPAAQERLQQATQAAGILTLRATPQYRASAMMQIDKSAQKVVGINAELAARIADQMAKTFIAIKLESSVCARQFLEDQIRQTTARLQESERIISDCAKKNAILDPGDKTSAIAQNFVDFSSALDKAQINGCRPDSTPRCKPC